MNNCTLKSIENINYAFKYDANLTIALIIINELIKISQTKLLISHQFLYLLISNLCCNSCHVNSNF